MDPADEAPKPKPRFPVFEFRRMATLAPEQRKTKTFMVKKRLAVNAARGDQRNLGFGQFNGKSMLFPDLIVAPAARAVKFDDDRVSLLDAYLVYAVLVAIERQQPAIAKQAG